jgi:chromosome segregation ATPase
MFYTLGTAAKATGKTKTAIAESIKKGRISAIKDDFGRYQIDPAELHRVYPPLSEVDRQEDQKDGRDKTQELTTKIMVLEAQLQAIAELKAQIVAERDDLRADRDHWREEAAQIRRILTDQSAKPTAEAAASFWKRLFRNR